MTRFKIISIYAIALVFSLSGKATGVENFRWVTVMTDQSHEPIEGVSVMINQTFVGETGPLGRLLLPDGAAGDLIGFYHTSYSPAFVSRLELGTLEYNIYLQESVLNIQEVVINANRIKQDYQRTAKEVRTIDSKRMDEQYQANAADALGIDPNIFIQKSQSGGGSPMIRGMSTSRVLLTVDGIRMNNAIFRAGNVHNVISLDPESIANLEISLGPGSVLNGSDAMGGVMNINTYEAHYGDSTEVLQSLVFTLSNQSGQLARRPNFRINYGGLNWAGMTSITFSQYQDVRMGKNVLGWTPEYHLDNTLSNFYSARFGNLDTILVNENPYIQVNTGFDQRNFTNKFKIRISPRTEIKAGLHGSMTTDISRCDRMMEMNGDMPKYAKWNYGPQIWTLGYVALENRTTTRFSDWIKVTVAGQYYEESRDVRKLKNLEGKIQREQVYIGQFNVDASKKLGTRTKLVYGAEYIQNNLTSTAWKYHELDPDTTWPAQTRYADGSLWQSTSGFAMLHTDLSDRFSASGGVRLNGIHLFTPISFNGFEQDADLQFLAPSAELGFTYFRPTFKYFLNLSTGFRAPNIDDASKVFDSQPGALIIPNPDLHEERLYSAELGMKQKLGDHWALDASFYYSFLDEAMERAPFDFGGRDSVFYEGELSQVLAVQNIDYAWVWGYQFGVRSDISKNLHWLLHWSHPFGMDSQGNPLRHVNPFNATSTLSYSREKIRTNLILRYNGAVDSGEMPFSESEKLHMYAINEDGLPYSPSWYTINIHGSYHFSKNILLRVGLENLMDVRYRPYASGIAASGRSIFLSMRISV